MNIVLPTWVRHGILGIFVGFTCVYALFTAAVVPTAGPLTVVAVGVFVVGVIAGMPQRGASIRTPRALVLLAAAIAVPWLGSPALDPSGTFLNGEWYLSAVCCLSVQLLLERRLILSAVALAAFWVQTVVWAGPEGLLRFYVVPMTLIVVLIASCGKAVAFAAAEMRKAAEAKQTAAEWRSAQDAYHSQRQSRLINTQALADEMLHRIAAGTVTAADRAECLVLHQTIRDEIRGRRLLNDAMREQVIAHRRRGAYVQLMDDGGLDDLPQEAVDPLLDRAATALAGVQSDRIVVRTMPPDSPIAVSVVATTSDPIAAALGLDEDEDQVDLWLELDRPVAVTA